LNHIYSTTILHNLFEKVFCTPAISAAVERMFSHSGLFMRSHRARIGIGCWQI